MFNEKFVNILQKEEEILWANGVNVNASLIKRALKNIPILLFALPFISIFVVFTTIIVTGFAMRSGTDPFIILLQFLKDKGALFGVILIAIVILSFIIVNVLIFKNTFFAITNKRIIRRTGAFNNKFIHYSLKNIGTIEVSGSIFDGNKDNSSANLLINTKNFHNNTDIDSAASKLVILSLKDAYNAYKMLSELTDGNNESMRIKNVN